MGVFTVRRITDKPSIVVTVDRKLGSIPQKEMLPAEVENVPVGVREATGLQRLRAVDLTAYSLAKTHLRRELQEPDWTGERTLLKGQPLKETMKAPMAGVTNATKKPELDYTPPAGVKLDPVQGNMSIIANASTALDRSISAQPRRRCPQLKHEFDEPVNAEKLSGCSVCHLNEDREEQEDAVC